MSHGRHLNADRIVLAVLAGLAFAVFMMIGPAPAGAKQITYSQYAFLTANATNDHTLWVGAERKGGKGYVSIFVDRFDGGGAQYTVLGTVTDRRISGDFGSFGKVNIRLKPRGRVYKHTVRGCKRYGKATSKYRDFRGTGVVRFGGEDGYTQFRETAGSGKGRTVKNWDMSKSVNSAAMVRCFSDSLGPKLRPQDGYVELFAEGDVDTSVDPRGGQFALSAVRASSLYSFTEIGVNVFEVNGAVSITRFGDLEGRAGLFAFDRLLDNATLLGTDLMSGTGTFVRDNGPATWTGDLAISLPGRADIPLTGPDTAVLLRPARYYNPTVPTMPGEDFF